jgi:hypothetical protein
MEELIKQGQSWWPVAVPILTGAFALFGSWLGSRLGKVTEHVQWLRNSKQAAYAEFLSAIVEASSTLDPAPEAREAQRRSAIALSQVRLIGAQGVTSAAVSFGTHVNEMHRLSRDRREMIRLDYSANEAAITETGAKLMTAIKGISALTDAFVHSARLDVGTQVG